MSDSDVNERILREVDEIDSDNTREFIREALEFERSKLDKDQPHFRNEYNSLIEKYVEIQETDDSVDTEGDE